MNKKNIHINMEAYEKRPDLKESIARNIEDRRYAEAQRLRRDGLAVFLFSTFVTEILLFIATIIIAGTIGQIFDYIPYVGAALSNTLNAFTNSTYFTGNLDKLGITIGVLAYAIKIFFKRWNFATKNIKERI